LEKIDEYAWNNDASINGIPSLKLVSELLRNALNAKCKERGLQYCRETKLTYFPSGVIPKERIKYARPDGKSATVNVSGKRKFFRPGAVSEYRYYLAPDFFIKRDIFGNFSVALRIRIRITDIRGGVLPPRTRLSRRKHLCKNWWNDDWLHRILAIAQYLSDGDLIVIGRDGDERITLRSDLVAASAPRGMQEGMLGSAAYEDRAELLREPDDDQESE
jgi:hypothetical protein